MHIELMPVIEFNGVDLFAPHHTYGTEKIWRSLLIFPVVTWLFMRCFGFGSNFRQPAFQPSNFHRWAKKIFVSDCPEEKKCIPAFSARSRFHSRGQSKNVLPLRTPFGAHTISADSRGDVHIFHWKGLFLDDLVHSKSVKQNFHRLHPVNRYSG